MARRCSAPARTHDIGALLTASHASLRDAFEVTVSELDLAVDTALALGAHWARMTGAGFGGSVIALIDHADAGPMAAGVQRELTNGAAAPTHVVATPSAGAPRIG